MRHLGHSFAVLVVTISLLAAIIVAAGCGGPSAAQRAKTRSLQANYLEQGVISFERKQNLAEANSAYAQCNSQVGATMRDLRAVDKVFRPNGFNASTFLNKLSATETAAKKIPDASYNGACGVVVDKAIKALDAYTIIVEELNACVPTGNCNVDEMYTHKSAAFKSVKMMGAKLAAIAQPKAVTTPVLSVPLVAAQVQASIYGRALADFCGSNVPADAIKPCADLRMVLVGGVTDSELGTLDSAVSKLNKAYNFSTA